jgi:hypothetical protein
MLLSLAPSWAVVPWKDKFQACPSNMHCVSSTPGTFPYTCVCKCGVVCCNPWTYETSYKNGNVVCMHLPQYSHPLLCMNICVHLRVTQQDIVSSGRGGGKSWFWCWLSAPLLHLCSSWHDQFCHARAVASGPLPTLVAGCHCICAWEHNVILLFTEPEQPPLEHHCCLVPVKLYIRQHLQNTILWSV